MNIMLYFTGVFVGLFSLLTAVDVIEEIETLCRFISNNDDVVDDIVACKKYNLPERLYEITAKCQFESAGVTNGDFLRATCHNSREQNTEMLRKVAVCSRGYKNEISSMSYQVAIGLRKAKECIKKINKRRMLANNRPSEIW